MKPYLNVGCGCTYHESWENIDIVAHSGMVRQHDITKGLPYPDCAFDALYASHVLEHVPRESVDAFIEECVRVVRPGGILRFVVPDFEIMAKLYLECFNKAINGDRDAVKQHEWMILEIIDQAVRTTSGGMMKQFLTKEQNGAVFRFIKTRIGYEIETIFSNANDRKESKPWSVGMRLLPRKMAKTITEFCAFVVYGRKGRDAAREGFFRAGGEVHRWVYDRLSMRQLLEKHGCRHVAKVDADTSSIPNFNLYNLDSIDGRIRKPDSLFMEAAKK